MDQDLIKKLCSYFASKPIKKVWLFGSYARGEQKADSDIDLMFEPDRANHFSLFTQGGIYMDLKKMLGKNVDFVEKDALRPYAAQSANRDKILIYERTSKG